MSTENKITINIEQQKIKLAHAYIKNINLKEKYKELELECRTIADTIISSQLNRAEKEETSLKLRKELNTSKRFHLQTRNELSMALKQVDYLSGALDENNISTRLTNAEEKALDELLSLKDEMVKCLQEELVEFRLKTAEDEVLIRELRTAKDVLMKDTTILTETPSNTVAALQDELLASKMREMEIGQQFESIRKELNEMKTQINKCSDAADSNNVEAGVVILPNKLALWKSNKNQDIEKEIQNYEKSIDKFEYECLSLKDKLEDLVLQTESLNEQINFQRVENDGIDKEIERYHISTQQTGKETEKIRIKNLELEKSMNEQLMEINNKQTEKDEEILKLTKRYEELLIKIKNDEIINSEIIKQKEEDLIDEFEQQMCLLQNKIDEHT